MSEAGMLTLVGWAIMVGLAACSAVGGIFGYMLKTSWADMKRRIANLEHQVIKRGERLIHLESHLERKGLVPPMPVEDASPIHLLEEGA